VALKTTCIKNVKLKIVQIRTGCRYIRHFNHSQNLNWAAQSLRLGHMQPTGCGLNIAGLHGCEIACSLKQTFALCRIFLQGTLLVTNFTNLCKRIWLMKQTLNMRQQLSINLRYCYLSRRATQKMAATRNSPTIGINVRDLSLSAVSVSLHYLPRCMRSIVTCGKTPTPPWLQGCQTTFEKKAKPGKIKPNC